MADISNAALAQAISDLVAYWSDFYEEYANWISGTVDGGPLSDGNYPLTDFLGVETTLTCPAKLADNVTGYVATVAASASAASTSETNAGTSETNAAASAVTATAQAALADADRIAAAASAATATNEAVTATAQAANASADAASIAASLALVAQLTEAKTVTGQWTFDYGNPGSPPYENGLIVYNSNNTDATYAPNGWRIIQGEGGTYDGYLLIGAKGSSAFDITLRAGAAPNFLNGLTVSNDESFASGSSASIARYQPYSTTLNTNKGGGYLDFRGNNPGDLSGTAQFRWRAYVYGATTGFGTIAEWDVDSDKVPTFNFYGDVASTGAVTGSNLNVSNWDTAYGWGDHTGLYAPIAGYNNTNWDTAYGWGNHATQGYAPTASPTFTGTLAAAAITASGNITANGNIVGDGATTISAIETITMDQTGDITKSGEGNYLFHASSSYNGDQAGSITFSTAAPSGGVNGDIWFEYTA